jgi:hypothetical protein
LPVPSQADLTLERGLRLFDRIQISVWPFGPLSFFVTRDELGPTFVVIRFAGRGIEAAAELQFPWGRGTVLIP